MPAVQDVFVPQKLTGWGESAVARVDIRGSGGGKNVRPSIIGLPICRRR